MYGLVRKRSKRNKAHKTKNVVMEYYHKTEILLITRELDVSRNSYTFRVRQTIVWVSKKNNRWHSRGDKMSAKYWFWKTWTFL